MNNITPIRPLRPTLPEKSFRLDLFFEALGEAGFAWLDRRLNTGGMLVNNFWHGPEGLRGVLEQKLDEYGVPREQLTPRMLAERAGFIKRRGLRRVG